MSKNFEDVQLYILDCHKKCFISRDHLYLFTKHRCCPLIFFSCHNIMMNECHKVLSKFLQSFKKFVTLGDSVFLNVFDIFRKCKHQIVVKNLWIFLGSIVILLIVILLMLFLMFVRHNHQPRNILREYQTPTSKGSEF